MREYHVRICEGLGVKFPGSTRHSRPSHREPKSTIVRYYPNSDLSRYHRKPCERLLLCLPSRHYWGVIMNRGIKFVPFCVLATILTASCANTIIFQCGTSFAVDLKNNTVNNQPATINATAIDWQLTPGPADDAGVVYYHIDRTTGILTENFTYRLPNGSIQSDDPTTYRCTVAPPTIPRFRR